MRLAKIGFQEFKKNIVMNLLIMIQMVAVFGVTVCMVSSFYSRYHYYGTFRKELTSKGYYIDVNDMYQNEDKLLVTKSEQLEHRLPKAKNVIATYNIWWEPEEGMMQTYAYDDEIIEAFTPEMESGEWLTVGSHSNMLEAVVSENDQGIEVGDVLKFYVSDTQTRREKRYWYEVKVIGVLKKNARVFGKNRLDTYYQTYEDLFWDTSVQEVNGMFVLMSQSQFDLFPEVEVQHEMFENAFVLYDDSLTEEELTKERQNIAICGELSQSLSLSEMNHNSIELLLQKVMELFPLLAAIAVLTILSVISVCSILINRGKYNYAVYYTLGNSKSDLIRLCLIQMSFAYLSAFLLLLAGYIVYKLSGFDSQFVVELTGREVLGCGVILLLFEGITFIVAKLKFRDFRVRDVWKE